MKNTAILPTLLVTALSASVFCFLLLFFFETMPLSWSKTFQDSVVYGAAALILFSTLRFSIYPTFIRLKAHLGNGRRLFPVRVFGVIILLYTPAQTLWFVYPGLFAYQNLIETSFYSFSDLYGWGALKAARFSTLCISSVSLMLAFVWSLSNRAQYVLESLEDFEDGNFKHPVLNEVFSKWPLRASIPESLLRGSLALFLMGMQLYMNVRIFEYAKSSATSLVPIGSLESISMHLTQNMIQIGYLIFALGMTFVLWDILVLIMCWRLPGTSAGFSFVRTAFIFHFCALLAGGTLIWVGRYLSSTHVLKISQTQATLLGATIGVVALFATVSVHLIRSGTEIRRKGEA